MDDDALSRWLNNAAMKATRALIRPKALRPGDTIAIAPLSSQLEAGESFDMYGRGVAELECSSRYSIATSTLTWSEPALLE